MVSQRATATTALEAPAVLAGEVLRQGFEADLEAALAAGSTMVRVGSALFGSR